MPNDYMNFEEVLAQDSWIDCQNWKDNWKGPQLDILTQPSIGGFAFHCE